jgi:hypothetical protein
MKTKEFYVEVPGVDPGFICNVVSLALDIDFNNGTCEQKLVFIHGSNTYKYVWSSSPTLGLGYLFENDKCVYDPYKNKGQNTAMNAIAIQLLSQVLASFVPKSAMQE